MNKKITYKEAAARLTHNAEFDKGWALDCEALELAVESLEQADKYRWHDIVENGSDYPSLRICIAGYVSDHVLCLTEKGTYIVTYCHKLKGDGELCWDYPLKDGDKIIAWREIEPFEEGEE